MAVKNFSGIFPLFIEFNNSLYTLFPSAPLYIGKLFIGFFYGIILGFLLTFWRKEILYNSILISSSLWILSFLNCIHIKWEKIFFLLGISGEKIQLSDISSFFNIYFIECIITLIVCIIFYKTVEKYKY